MRYCYIPIGMAKILLMLTNTGKYMEQQELAYIVGNSIKWYSHFGIGPEYLTKP